jgi:hypothetical protein
MKELSEGCSVPKRLCFQATILRGMHLAEIAVLPLSLRGALLSGNRRVECSASPAAITLEIK